MILIFEMTWTGTIHAPSNSATIQIVAQAAPNQKIRVFADASHLTELKRNVTLTGDGHIEFQAITVSSAYRSKPHIVSLRRGTREIATIWRALRDIPGNEHCLVFLLSATPTAIVVASLLAKLDRRIVGVHVGLHGNLNDLTGWRSRNPLTRAFDLPAILARTQTPRVRFLVLEVAIKNEMRKLMPRAAAVTDVLQHPINSTEVDLQLPQRLSKPTRIGFVGQATDAKGIAPFLSMASDLKNRFGNDVVFELIGRVPPGSDLSRFAILDKAVTHDYLSREEFCARLACVHYVCLPFQSVYYNLSASGALIDAVTWLKPVIACRVPLVADLFEQFGDLGYLCANMDAMKAQIECLLASPDTKRYDKQIEAMRLARDARLPAALAKDYRNILLNEFRGLLAYQS